MVVGVPGRAVEPPIVLACCAQLLRVCEIPVASLDYAAIQAALVETAAGSKPEGMEVGPALGSQFARNRAPASAVSYETYPGSSDAMDGVTQVAEPSKFGVAPGGYAAASGGVGGFNSRPLYNPSTRFG